jgi:hypothetical protein
MLIVNVQVNNRLIDEIHIHNISTDNGDLQTYRIEKPEGHENTVIKHRYSTGYKSLVIAVLEYLDKKVVLNKK